jgi:hypothetical protein
MGNPSGMICVPGLKKGEAGAAGYTPLPDVFFNDPYFGVGLSK